MKNFHFSFYIFPLLAILFFSSCSSEPSADKEQGFPQLASQKNSKDVLSGGSNVNFIPASRAVTPGVVHIKTLYQQNPGSTRFPDSRSASPQAMGSGSGVVISPDGYIATNNHVIENASQIEVVFTDRRSFTASEAL